ncbi:hypothetical protein A3B05_00625 [Candidatus Giovannonibacteria bacterium RIFCSPLOWO2_01_FULL_43_160]|uniref:Uncharacterized protein n=3 Tax=Parcubacteria group TaxID=1794811 RepID=A0A0G0KBZ7_9BACT|nr:MAG: hypothetical protein US65_C0032G0003 [Candidatus Yanofskybacteria bacterium GW2011_GWC2_37_9]KKS95368.1 MAG: hypothetical protein UV72_C0011G0008 [Candidatus Giovannonibacteria bacterium GW2011_GWB1_43_13]KKS99087.1 MAG: hypothetical protein UV75_C0010G0008 [Candidatus Giovannonibacteria bacterium GW2011_GWA1_43_15]KKT62776.1 MAG: hypothetical protein UW55_C0009G0007 [Candidatus Giovannonibacteria bacterium GW2011_GWA2_44_26]OGF59053.1 MAG: hypothetical protein A2652_02965 [Candidatus G
MGETTILKGFNFWSKKTKYSSRFSVQSMLGPVGEFNEGLHATGCSSDQGGSQEGGGMDCNSGGDA